MPFLSCISQALLRGKEQINTNVCIWTNPTLQLRYLLPGFNELSNIYYFASFPVTVSLHHSFLHPLCLAHSPPTIIPASMSLCTSDISELCSQSLFLTLSLHSTFSTFPVHSLLPRCYHKLEPSFLESESQKSSKGQCNKVTISAKVFFSDNKGPQKSF